MKWFKHVTDASDDEFIAALEAHFGLEGYARWWKMLEAIGKQMKPGCKQAVASYTPKKWMELLGIKQLKHLQSFTNFCQTSEKALINCGEMFWEIEVPKLLEMADEYSKKSRHATSSPPDTGRTKEEEGEEEGEGEASPSVDKSTSPPTPKKSAKPKARTTEPFVLPDWIPAPLWADFMETRQRRKAANTDKAKWLLVIELEKLREQKHDPVKVVEQSIMRGWTGVFRLKDEFQDQGSMFGKGQAQKSEFESSKHRDGREVV